MGLFSGLFNNIINVINTLFTGLFGGGGGVFLSAFQLLVDLILGIVSILG